MPRKPCAFDAPHHSNDRVTVHAGSPDPITLCGYHASDAWLPTALNSLSVLDCGHAPTETDGPGTGYATTADGRRICYACADEAQREDMRTAQRFTAYLSGDHRTLTSWTGGKLGTVTRYTTDRGRSSTYGTVHRCYVRVTDVHGNHWTGTGPVENGDYVNLRRVKV